MAVEDPGSIEAQRIARARLMFGTEGRCPSCKAVVFGGAFAQPEEHHPRCLEGLLLRVSWRMALADTEPGCEIVEATLDKCIERAVERMASVETPEGVFGLDLVLDADRMIPEAQKAFEALFYEKVQKRRDERLAAANAEREAEKRICAEKLQVLFGVLFDSFRGGRASFVETLRAAAELRATYGAAAYAEALVVLQDVAPEAKALPGG